MLRKSVRRGSIHPSLLLESKLRAPVEEKGIAVAITMFVVAA